MTGEPGSDKAGDEECITPATPVPTAALGRYSVDRDPDSEEDVAGYVAGQALGEEVQHVERVKSEFVLGVEHVIWDVTTDKDRYWVITGLTNLYSQRHFASLDYTLSFHVGLMMRLRSRPDADEAEPSPFDDVFRRQQQAKDRLDRAVEAEDFQAVGMVLRESLLSLVSALRRRVDIPASADRPKDGAFIDWTGLLFDTLCPGSSNKELRQHLKTMSREAWQLVGWLTHARSANVTACSIAVYTCDTIVGHSVQILERHRTDKTQTCPLCRSRNLRTHFDISIAPDGDYYLTCGSCRWSSHSDARGGA